MKLISAVMPTRGRKELAALALQSFLSQTYPAKELVILDDEDDPSFPEVPVGENIRYRRLTDRYNIPQKRNIVNGMAEGEILCHFDSDDWSAPERMADQAYRLLGSQKAVTGYSSMLFHDPGLNLVAKYQNAPNFCALGTSLCYLKSWWQEHQFEERRVLASDSHFVVIARDATQLVSMDAGLLMVALSHPDDTRQKRVTSCDYAKKTMADLPEGYLLQCKREFSISS